MPKSRDSKPSRTSCTQCPDCGKCVSRKQDLARHRKTHILDDSLQHYCPEEDCTFSALQKQNVKTHWNARHSKHGFAYTCPVCQKGFRSANKWSQHRVELHGYKKQERTKAIVTARNLSKLTFREPSVTSERFEPYSKTRTRNRSQSADSIPSLSRSSSTSDSDSCSSPSPSLDSFGNYEAVYVADPEFPAENAASRYSTPSLLQTFPTDAFKEKQIYARAGDNLLFDFEGIVTQEPDFQGSNSHHAQLPIQSPSDYGINFEYYEDLPNISAQESQFPGFDGLDDALVFASSFESNVQLNTEDAYTGNHQYY